MGLGPIGQTPLKTPKARRSGCRCGPQGTCKPTGGRFFCARHPGTRAQRRIRCVCFIRVYPYFCKSFLHRYLFVFYSCRIAPCRKTKRHGSPASAGGSSSIFNTAIGRCCLLPQRGAFVRHRETPRHGLGLSPPLRAVPTPPKSGKRDREGLAGTLRTDARG